MHPRQGEGRLVRRARRRWSQASRPHDGAAPVGRKSGTAVTEATTRGINVQLYVDGRYASVSTNDLRPEALERFLDDSVAMARTLTADAFRTLPDPKLYAGRSNADLVLVDPKYGERTADARRALAKQLEDAARGVKGADVILSVTTNVADSNGRMARVTSNGFEGERETTDFSVSLDVSVK
ncbi:MAG TPA: DNA gyrase modulator, partial [Polyangiaceae bacterium]